MLTEKKIAIIGLIIASIAIIVSVLIPEIRIFVGLDNGIRNDSLKEKTFENHESGKRDKLDIVESITSIKQDKKYGKNDFEQIRKRGMRVVREGFIDKRIVSVNCKETSLQELLGEERNKFYELLKGGSVSTTKDTIKFDQVIQELDCKRILIKSSQFYYYYQIRRETSLDINYFLSSEELIIMENIYLPQIIDNGCVVGSDELEIEKIIDFAPNAKSFSQLCEFIKDHSIGGISLECAEFVAWSMASEINPKLIHNN